MRRFLILFSILASFAISSADAQTLPLNLRVQPPPTQAKFDKPSLYAVEVSCVQAGSLIPFSKQDLFVKKTYTTAISLLISTKPPTKKADGTETLSSAVAYVPVAVVNNDGKIELDNTNSCQQSYLVTNASRLFLVPAVSVAKTYQAGFLVNLIDKAIAFASAIAPAFITGGIPVAAANTLSDVQKSIKPLGDLLATLNKAENYTKTQNLRIGKTIVRTDYTTITIVVRRVSSIVSDKNQDFIDDLKKSIDAAPMKPAANDVNPNCTQQAVTLNNAGFRDDSDKAFAIGYLAIKIFNTKEQIISCLGGYVRPAAALGDFLWKGYPIRVTPADGENVAVSANTVTQPTFDSQRAQLIDLMDAMGQYARRDLSQPAPQTVVKRLSNAFAPEVKIIDRAGGVIASSDVSFDVPKVIDFLINKGFRRYGCFAEATDPMGRYQAGATVIFLAFRADPNARQTTVADGIAIHPLYLNGRVATLRVADNNSGWIDAVLADRARVYYCNNLEVKK